MSLPPTTILIKRKKNEDPVEALYIHQHKKRRPGHVYKRQNDGESEPKFLDIPQVDTSRKTKRAVSHQQRLGIKPVVQVSKPGDELRSQHGSSGIAKNASSAWEDEVESGTSTTESKPEVPTSNPQPRRFHLARTSTSDSPRSPAGINKKSSKGPIPMFFERTKEGKTHRRRSTVTRPLSDSQISQIQAMSRSNDRKLKRPGAASRVPSSTFKRSATPEVTQPPAPPGQEMQFPTANPWNVGSDELAAQMHAFTMQEIGRNIAASESSSPVRSPNRFKPKLPAQRYHERHPSDSARFGKNDSGADADGETSMEVDDDSDEDYVIDTYIRMSGEEPKEGISDFGLLILDEQMDIAEFYGEEESDSDEYDEDEDENAENHHSTDYPDEELGSDDEFGNNPYQYRNHNASDEEEWGEEDAYSDDENEATLHPWQKKPWLNRARPGEGAFDDSDDDSM